MVAIIRASSGEQLVNVAKALYQGGIDVIAFSDPDKPFEGGFFERGSIDPAPQQPIDAGPPASAAGAGRGGTLPPTRGAWGA